MAAAKAAGEAAMLKAVVQMVGCVGAAGVVTNPDLAINVRDVGVAVLVAVVALGVGSLGRAFVSRRPARRNRLMRLSTGRTGAPFPFVMLCKRWKGEHEQSYKGYLTGFHDQLLMPRGEQPLSAAFPLGGSSSNPIIPTQYTGASCGPNNLREPKP
jgi:hypothetical protein